MNCPVCSETMDYVDASYTTTIAPRGRRPERKVRVACAQYRCDGCTFEFLWTPRGGLHVIGIGVEPLDAWPFVMRRTLAERAGEWANTEWGAQ